MKEAATGSVSKISIFETVQSNISLMKIGIIFGGSSREREVSFAGGRTVFDNLNKSLFEAVPIFADSFGNLVLLNWHYIYKGSIRDFYPPVQFLNAGQNHEYQIYAESLTESNLSDYEANEVSISGISKETQIKLLEQIGRPVNPGDLSKYIDFAFLTLHGENGEDGRIQGILEWEGIPYSGSGIFASSLGMDKVLQKKFMQKMGFNVPKFFAFNRLSWVSGNEKSFFEDAITHVGFPLVVKSARQGSSIGVSILKSADFSMFCDAVEKSFFRRKITSTEWLDPEKETLIREIADFRHGIGFPLCIGSDLIYHPSDLHDYLDGQFSSGEQHVLIESLSVENEILIEGFIKGKEFSCIVLDDTLGQALALPPTEIRKSEDFFDYRSKYLPGLSRKITPIELSDSSIKDICDACERLYTLLHFDVYARIDGFITGNGEIFLNDPNTTSGMMPSSFFFHQAAEIGLNPSQFLTYIIYCSLRARIKTGGKILHYEKLTEKLMQSIAHLHAAQNLKIKVGIIFGGYSSERHISVESGRNIYEKLSSSTKYEPIPIFLTGSAGNIELYQVPINILLKDNADDIKEKIQHFSIHPVVSSIVKRAEHIITFFGANGSLKEPQHFSFEELSLHCKAVFIALHGRPGEDGEIQAELEKVNLPFNGSGIESSKLTIDKYQTNEKLRKAGILVANHRLYSAETWKINQENCISEIEKTFNYPFIAKPCDDGCSSAVKKIESRAELTAYLKLIFRETEHLGIEEARVLKLHIKEEFPIKKVVLIEDLIGAGESQRFMEITGGMLTHMNKDGERIYEVFEPSEALAEGQVLSLEEKFLAGEGQNITPPRYSLNTDDQHTISNSVKEVLEEVARILNVEGYCRIDAFVRVFEHGKAEVIIIEVNSLPGMTPATAIFHQAALNDYKPYDFINSILDYAFQNKAKQLN